MRRVRDPGDDIAGASGKICTCRAWVIAAVQSIHDAGPGPWIRPLTSILEALLFTSFLFFCATGLYGTLPFRVAGHGCLLGVVGTPPGKQLNWR